MPALVPLLINYVDARTDVLVPAQAWFGPAALLGYLWLRRRYGRERTMKEFRRVRMSCTRTRRIRGRPRRPARYTADSPSSPARTMVGAAGTAQTARLGHEQSVVTHRIGVDVRALFQRSHLRLVVDVTPMPKRLS